MSKRLLIQESYVNATLDTRIGETEVYESFTEKRGALFRALQKEHGRCTGRVYVDMPSGRSKRVGWVFQKREQYSDTGRYGRPAQFYIHEVWVTIHRKAPKTLTKFYY